VARRTTRRIMRRRLVVGGMVLLAAGGTAAAVKLSQKDAQQIEQHTGVPPEQLEDDELHSAMQELGNQSQPLTAQDQAALGVAPPARAPPPQAPAAAPQASCLQEIEQLAGLRDKGILTEEEFQAKKKQLLGLGGNPGPRRAQNTKSEGRNTTLCLPQCLCPLRRRM
jgi:hypothetical protein